jgi:homoserine kinase type II
LQVFVFSGKIKKIEVLLLPWLLPDSENQNGGDRMSSDPAAEIKAILAHYDLGELVDYERNTRGFVNTSYAIVTLRDGQERRYFLRRYKIGIREEELQFEHSLIDHLVNQQFSCVARIMRARSGGSYLKWKSGSGFSPDEYIAIFQFLPGEDRYTWVNPACSETETVQAAEFLARYHNAVSGFKPLGQRSEAKIMDLLPAIAHTIASVQQRSKHTAFDQILAKYSASVLANLEKVRSRLEALGPARLPELVVHCDYHPGNLKFQEGEIVGLFDFDWSKTDLRLFDLALAIWYFCTGWEGETDGQLRLEQAARFLQAYQRTVQSLPGIGSLNPAELQALPDMLAASNLYILNWTVVDYYQKEVEVEEYLQYLWHSLHFIVWFEGQVNWLSLVQRISSARYAPAQE